jgi:hypothetical protein
VPINSVGSAFIYSTLRFPRSFAFYFRLATSFTVCAFCLCMARIKFTARPRTPIGSHKFGSLTSDEALEASAEHKEISIEQLEEIQ